LKDTILFLDLDNTIFQTKKRNKNGTVQATNTENSENVSYMTKAQEAFFNLFLESENSMIIPTTARNLEQYNKTLISKNEKIKIAVLYFSAVILENNEVDRVWEKHIQEKYLSLKISIDEMYKYIESIIDKDIFRLCNVDGFYVSLRNMSNKFKVVTEENKNLIEKLESFLDPDEYYIAHENKNISIVPKFLDKRIAVEFLIEKYKPSLAVGAGDSLSDISFLQICDFMAIPKRSQIDIHKIS